MLKLPMRVLSLATGVLIGACQEAKQAIPQAAIAETVAAVANRSVENQIYVRGGTFTMGDFGAVGEDGVWRPYFPPPLI